MSDTPSQPAKEGWVYLANARKPFHYIRGGQSLCGKWGYLGSSFDPHNGSVMHKDDCTTCYKKLTGQK